jgi:hypothetical protein
MAFCPSFAGAYPPGGWSLPRNRRPEGRRQGGWRTGGVASALHRVVLWSGARMRQRQSSREARGPLR